MTLRNADPDLNENTGGSTDLGHKIARIDGFRYPYSLTPLLDKRTAKNAATIDRFSHPAR